MNPTIFRAAVETQQAHREYREELTRQEPERLRRHQAACAVVRETLAALAPLRVTYREERVRDQTKFVVAIGNIALPLILRTDPGKQKTYVAVADHGFSDSFDSLKEGFPTVTARRIGQFIGRNTTHLIE